MCGRFTHRYTWREIHRLYSLTSPASNVQPSYNVCPTDTVNVVSLSKRRIPRRGGRMEARGAHCVRRSSSRLTYFVCSGAMSCGSGVFLRRSGVSRGESGLPGMPHGPRCSRARSSSLGSWSGSFLGRCIRRTHVISGMMATTRRDSRSTTTSRSFTIK
jgi:hypothetical protein